MATAETSIHPRAAAVLEYWFDSASTAVPKDYFVNKFGTWFARGDSAPIDEYIRTTFGEDVAKIGNGDYDSWLENPYSGMAGVILMDQFTRNVFRGTPAAFSLDETARKWTNQLLDTGAADALPHIYRGFLFLTFEHSEDLKDQERAVALYTAESEAAASAFSSDHPATKMIAAFLTYAIDHKSVIDEFGRFPHRNKILGRPNTAKEEEGFAAGTIKTF